MRRALRFAGYFERRKRQCFFLSQYFNLSQNVKPATHVVVNKGGEAICLLASWRITKQRSSVIGKVRYRAKSTTHPWTFAFCKKKNSCLPPGKLSMWQEQNGSQKQLKIFKRFSWYRKYLQGEARKMRTPLQPSGPEQSQSDLKGNRFQMLHFIFTWEVRRRGRGWGCDLCFHLLCVTWNFLFVISSSVVQN